MKPPQCVEAISESNNNFCFYMLVFLKDYYKKVSQKNRASYILNQSGPEWETLAFSKIGEMENTFFLKP